jgi:hypothetical protein
VFATKSPELALLMKDYQKAREQHSLIVRHLPGALEVLPKADCQL